MVPEQSLQGILRNRRVTRSRQTDDLSTSKLGNTASTSTTKASVSILSPPPPKASWSLGTHSQPILRDKNTSSVKDAGREEGPKPKSTPLPVTVLPSPTSTTSSAQTNTVSSKTDSSFSNAFMQKKDTHNSDCWVLVYGYATQHQYHDILRLFSSYGTLLDHRGHCVPGQSNWIAIQYASPLQAQQALQHQHVPLVDPKTSATIFCGVKSLRDDDPILRQTAPIPIWKNNTRDGEVTHEQSQIQDSSVSPGQDDPLLRYYPRPRESQSICEKFARWILGIE